MPHRKKKAKHEGILELEKNLRTIESGFFSSLIPNWKKKLMILKQSMGSGDMQRRVFTIP